MNEALESVEGSEFGLVGCKDVSDLDLCRLGIVVLKIWARVFRGNALWAVIDQIGESLQLLAEHLEGKVLSA